MASSTPSIQSAAQPFGSALIGTFLGAIIYGITVLQTFIYYNRYHTDRLPWKILVGIVLVLDSAGLSLFMQAMYYYLLESWGIPEMLAVDTIALPVEYILTSFLVFIVQLFYINTIRALRAPAVVTILLLVLAVVALSTGLILPGIQLKLRLIPVIVRAPLNHTAFNIARSTALGCDVGIVIALCWLLGKRRTNITRANNMLNVFIVVAVQRGLLQAVVQAGEVLSYAIRPANVYFLPFHVIVQRIYCVSLLAALNTREYAASKLHRGASDSSSFGPGVPPVPGPAPSGGLLTSILDPPHLSALGPRGGDRDEEGGGGGGGGGARSPLPAPPRITPAQAAKELKALPEPPRKDGTPAGAGGGDGGYHAPPGLFGGGPVRLEDLEVMDMARAPSSERRADV